MMLGEFNEKREAVLTWMRQLAALAGELGSASVKTRISSGLIEKLEANRFHLVVVGEFNHGKTTFVNALLGASVLPVGVTPTTAVIHEIEYGEAPAAYVLYESGQQRDVPFEQVRMFAIGNEAPSPDPGPVRVLHVRFPADLLQQQVSLVDTPGVNDLSLQRADITYKYIPQSDAVLFLLDAGQLVKESERVFLQDKLLGRSRDKIVFVVTKRDILDDGELAQAMSYVHEQLEKLVAQPRVFAVAAEAALKGNRGTSGMDELLGFLTKFLAEERGRILLDNAIGESLAIVTLLRKGVDAKRRGLEMTVEELSRRIQSIEVDLAGQAQTIEQRRASIREEAAAIKAWARRDLDRFVHDVTAQIPELVDKADVAELKRHLGPYLESTFRTWARAETKEIADALEKLAETTIALVREDARTAGERLANTLGADLRTPSIEVDTFAYDVGVAALAGVGLSVLFSNWMLGGLLVLAAPVLALYVRDRVEAQTRNRAKDLAPKAMAAAAATVGPKLDEMIDLFVERLDAWAVTAGEEVHREVLEVLASARRERERGEAARALALSLCQKHDAELTKAHDGLAVLRAQLRSQPVEGSAETPTESRA